MSSAPRIAIDIGGTFTDAVLQVGATRYTAKVLTTRNPAEGFMQGIAHLLSQSGVSPADVALITHGTTLATNALIERRGAKTALIVTEGHRDSLEIGYENRFDQYNLMPIAGRRWYPDVCAGLCQSGSITGGRFSDPSMKLRLKVWSSASARHR